MQHGISTSQTGLWSVADLARYLTPKSFKVLAEAGKPAQVPPTLAGAHLSDVTDPQHRALRTAAETGVIERGGPTGASVTTLKAMARKGLVRLHMVSGGRRYEIGHATITAAGERHLARLDAAAEQAEQRMALISGYAA
jgi:3,4-dihydroxy-2-butanone 4-phosphate synthase